MNLNAYVSALRRDLLEDLHAGRDPRVGTFDPNLLKEGRTKSPAQMGDCRFEPEAILLEFVFPEAGTRSTVLTVRVPSPERIVYLPVPEWVVEDVWHGEVHGSYEFESDARRMVSRLHDLLAPETNRELFGPKPCKHREASW